MIEFCPECSNLLRKKNLGGEFFMVCKCGYQRTLKNPAMNNQDEIERKKRDLEKNLVILSEEDKINVHPIVKKICPKCGNYEAEAWQKQIRSADEPSTSFFKCAKCKHTWREN
jgi:DNA-directed RNA polymerase subunit M